jgi:hypothetical protein
MTAIQRCLSLLEVVLQKAAIFMTQAVKVEVESIDGPVPLSSL